MQEKCWICGDDGDLTGEHMSKKSDLKAELSKGPFYLHTPEKKNIKIQGFNSDRLKSAAKLCKYCNSTRTQPHDRAWEKLSSFLRKGPIQIGSQIYLNRVFPNDAVTSMLNVHLYFVKLFGCKIQEFNLPIDIKPFSQAILQTKPHPQIYIAICPKLTGEIGPTEILYLTDPFSKETIFASWYYELPKFSIRIMFDRQEGYREGLIDAWHPSNVKECIRIASI